MALSAAMIFSMSTPVLADYGSGEISESIEFAESISESETGINSVYASTEEDEVIATQETQNSETDLEENAEEKISDADAADSSSELPTQSDADVPSEQGTDEIPVDQQEIEAVEESDTSPDGYEELPDIEINSDTDDEETADSEQDEEVSEEETIDDESQMAGSDTTWQDGSLTISFADGVLSVSGSGAMTDYTASDRYSLPWSNYVYQVDKIVINSGVTHIGAFSFVSTSASQISIAETVTSIGNYAFGENTNLTSVSIPGTVKEIGDAVFADCYNLSSVTLNPGIQSLGGYLFQNTCFKTLTIPASVSSIGFKIAISNESMQTFQVDSGNSYFSSEGGVLFDKAKSTLIDYPIGKTGSSYTVPGSVRTIGNSAFLDQKYLTAVNVNKTTTIEDWAFARVTGLATITLPSTVTALGNGPFDGCTSLKSAYIKAPITVTPYRFFSDCTSLQTVELPGTLQELYLRTFYNCSSLKSIALPASLQTIDVYAFYGCTGLTSLTIPDSVTVIEDGAFEGCTNLKVTYPAGLTEMADGSHRLIIQETVTGTFDYSEANAVLTLVNQERAKYGADPLKMDAELLEAAMQRAAEISVSFSHTRPDGTDCFSISSKITGENIAAWQSNAAAVMNSWNNSPGHHSNIISTGFKSIGIGCFIVNGAHYWVQVFGWGEASGSTKSGQVKKSTTVNVELADDYVGLAKLNGTWFYVKNKKINTTCTNLVEYNGSWFYVKNGKVDWSANTLAQVNGKGTWYYVKNGKIDWSANTFAQVNGKGTWYYVKNGKLDWSYNGLVQYNKTWYYIQNGKLNWNYTNLVLYNGTWYYVKNGKIDWSANTLAQVNGKGTWYYVKNGKLDWTYNGLQQYYGTWYYIQNGKLNWNYSNLVLYNGTWFYVKNGKIDWNVTTLAQVNGKGTWYYVKNGKIDWNYTGNFKFNGKTYKIKKGIVQ